MKHLMAQYKYTCYSCKQKIIYDSDQICRFEIHGTKIDKHCLFCSAAPAAVSGSTKGSILENHKNCHFYSLLGNPIHQKRRCSLTLFKGTGGWDGGVLMARPFLILFNASSSPMLCRLSILVSQHNTKVIYFLQIRSISNSEPNGHGISFSCVSIAVWRCSKTICGNDKQGWSLHWERLQRISVIQALEFFQGWQYE